MQKMVQLLKVFTPPVNNPLSWYGAICFGPYFCVQQQQEFIYSGGYKRGASKVSSWTKFTYWRLLRKKEITKKLLLEADALLNKNLCCPQVKLSNSQTLILPGVKTGVLLSDIAQQLRRKNADVPDIYFNLLDAAVVTPTLVLNQNAEAKKRGSWVPFKLRTTEVAKIVHAEGGAAYGSLQNWVKASNLSVSKVRQFFKLKGSVHKV